MKLSFNNWLNEELEKRGWSVRELGRRAQFSHSAISLVLSGERGPSWDMCAAIAKPLGKSPEFLFRKAGLLPPLPSPSDDLTLTELLEIARRLKPDQRQDLLEYALWRLNQQRAEAGENGNNRATASASSTA